MKFIHHANVISKFPQNYTGVLVIKDFTDTDVLKASVLNLQEKMKVGSRSNFLQEIISRWRNIFTQMGAKPKYKSSLESLYNFYTTNNKLYQISPLVDFYNYYSLYTGYPMAAYDSDKIKGSLQLKIIEKDLTFTPLGAPKVTEKTKDNEVAYIDEEKVICRYWNLQDCDQTRITSVTRNVVFIFDILANDKESAVKMFEVIVKDFTEVFHEIYYYGVTGFDLSAEVELD